MTLHSIILFFHVGAALGMAATIGILATYTHLLTRASSLAEAGVLYRLADRMSVTPKVLAPTLLLTGGWLAYERHGMSEPWMIGGVVILVFLALVGMFVLHPRVHAAVRDAGRKGDVTLIARRLGTPWLGWLVTMRTALFVLVIFFMTTKPNARVTITASVATVLIATAAARLRLPQRAEHA